MHNANILLGLFIIGFFVHSCDIFSDSGYEKRYVIYSKKSVLQPIRFRTLGIASTHIQEFHTFFKNLFD